MSAPPTDAQEDADDAHVLPAPHHEEGEPRDAAEAAPRDILDRSDDRRAGAMVTPETRAIAGTMMRRAVALRAAEIMMESAGSDLASVSLCSADQAAEASRMVVGVDLDRWEAESAVHKALCAIATEDDGAALHNAAMALSDASEVPPEELIDRLARAKLREGGVDADTRRGDAAATAVAWGVITASIKHPQVLAVPIGVLQHRATQDALFASWPKERTTSTLPGDRHIPVEGADHASGTRGDDGHEVFEAPHRPADDAGTAYHVDMLLVESALPLDLLAALHHSDRAPLSERDIATAVEGLSRREAHGSAHEEMWGYLLDAIESVWTEVTTIIDGSSSVSLGDSDDTDASTAPSTSSTRVPSRARTIELEAFSRYVATATHLRWEHSAFFVWPVVPVPRAAGHGFAFEFGPLDAREILGLPMLDAATAGLPPPTDRAFGWVLAAWPGAAVDHAQPVVRLPRRASRDACAAVPHAVRLGSLVCGRGVSYGPTASGP
jgi:hypothetical protein